LPLLDNGNNKSSTSKKQKERKGTGNRSWKKEVLSGNPLRMLVLACIPL
jgi:hypothetical protein